MSEANKNQQASQQHQPQFEILRIYAKDCSVETPSVPAIFTKQWKPQINVEFDTKPSVVNADQGHFEVDMRITVTCTNEGETAFICEVHQAGLFLLRNLGAEASEYLLQATAPNILFPYAREHIASLVGRTTFPSLNLRPINFEAIYRARKLEQAQKAKSGDGKAEQAQPAEQPHQS